MSNKLNEINLPEVNERRAQSNLKQIQLRFEIESAIYKFQQENNYKFESYEIDNVLLDMIKKNHESYLNTKFGYVRS